MWGFSNHRRCYGVGDAVGDGIRSGVGRGLTAGIVNPPGVPYERGVMSHAAITMVKQSQPTISRAAVIL